MKPFLFILSPILILFTMLSTSCRENALPPEPAEPVEVRATVTASPASPTSITPAVPTEVSSAVQVTPTQPTNTPLPTTTVQPGPACTQIGQTWSSAVDGAILVCVPAGEFLMGAADNDPQAKDHEKPQHRVYLEAFWLDRTEVTNANFAKCMAEGACRPEIYEVSASTYVPYAVHPDYQDFPALLYEAEVAAAYCRWAGRRLPTEAEWEKAARGPEVRIYPWGNDLDCTKANYAECNRPPKLESPRCGSTPHCQTSGVEAHPTGASPYGALNMAGNVWEWVADWYAPDYYANSPARNPTGPEAGEFRVRRGGGNKSRTQEMRVTTRASGAPQHYFDGQMGFRCAASAVTP